jgi:hypothetical protein
MPFPLAHPAAVLPLRRFCPRLLSFPALVIGSLCPDGGYCFGKFGELSHTVRGSFEFCLPLGFIMLAVLYALRFRVVSLLAPHYRQAFLPLCERPAAPVLVLLVSLFLGIWTHLLWDSLTHTTGWLVQWFPVLQSSVTVFGGHNARICHLLWYACSFIGIVFVFMAFDQWRRASSSLAGITGSPSLRNAMLMGILLLPLELAHHLFRSWLGLCFFALLCGLLVAVVALKMTAPRNPCPPSEPETPPR